MCDIDVCVCGECVHPHSGIGQDFEGRKWRARSVLDNSDELGRKLILVYWCVGLGKIIIPGGNLHARHYHYFAVYQKQTEREKINFHNFSTKATHCQVLPNSAVLDHVINFLFFWICFLQSVPDISCVSGEKAHICISSVIPLCFADSCFLYAVKFILIKWNSSQMPRPVFTPLLHACAVLFANFLALLPLQEEADFPTCMYIWKERKSRHETSDLEPQVHLPKQT